MEKEKIIELAKLVKEVHMEFSSRLHSIDTEHLTTQEIIDVVEETKDSFTLNELEKNFLDGFYHVYIDTWMVHDYETAEDVAKKIYENPPTYLH
jgi:hypothetical protein